MNPAADSPAPVRQDGAAPADGPDARSRMPLDEKLYFAIVGFGLAVIATILVVTLLRTHREKEAARTVPDRQLIPFTLTDRTGRIVHRSELAGRHLVVNFVFTSCAISCLQVNHHMAEIQRLTADQPDVWLISLTVDPRTDTPAMLAKFADRFHADTNRWLFLTGEKQVLYPLIETSFLGQTGRHSHGDSIPRGMIHSDQIAVTDTTGRLRGLFDGLKPRSVAEVTNLLARLQSGVPR